MILVTGAAGKTGRAVINALAEQGERVRALVHRPEQSQIVHVSGAEESLVGDMTQKSTLDDAVKDIKAIYHICPNVNPDEVEMGRVAIAACLENGVRRFVYHSVLHPQTQEMPHHWLKLQVEELILQSGLCFTILQPSAYMQNIQNEWRRILEQGIFLVPYPIETRLCIVDLLDVAQAAATVLAGDVHIGAIYELAGPENLSQIEVAQSLTSELGDEIQAMQESLDVWKARLQGSGMGTYQLETLLKMFKTYARNGFVGNSVVLEHLLGRRPTTFKEFVRRLVKED